MNVLKKDIKFILLLISGVVTSVFVLFFLAIGVVIGKEVNATCKLATEHYGGTCVTALEKTVNDEANPYRVRNSAVWTLGQLGDPKALPTLKQHYTGTIPDREPLDHTLSQYELKKAIRLLQNGTNITAFIWRGSIH